MGQGRARGTLPDSVKDGDLFLFKRVSSLRATYQIKLCAYLAASRGKKLYLLVPETCQFHPSLTELMKVTDAVVRRNA